MSTTKNLGPFRLNPRGNFSSKASYRFLDVVSYNGGSYMCCNYDTIDGTACIGVLPEGASNSEAYWQCIAKKGEPGLIEVEYLPIGNLENGVWDFDITDKVYINESFTDILDIINVYEGCCGAILTSNSNLLLPTNSDYSIDFNYTNITNANQYYLYTFIYANMGAGSRFIWNRTVINKS
jgi:hypothetical protein